MYTKFGLNLSIRSQDMEQKPDSDVNQVTLLCCKFAKKTKNYNSKVDLVNDNVYAKFSLNRSIRSKILSKNQTLTSIKGRNSVANLSNSNSSKLSCMSS